ncbi:MAG: metallophosphoesterase [Cocleimonas sp.]|nr:metallophosphoesterase [Cocleimonas sp.]
MRWLTVEHTPIPLRSLPSALEGFSIVQLTDMHLRPFTQIDHIQRAVKLSNALNPDIIVLTGDYVWHDAEDILELVPTLANLRAKYGVFAILGNHEYKTNAPLIRRTFERYNIPVYTNFGAHIDVGDASVYLAGIDDGWLGRPNIDKTLENYRQDQTPIILMAHEPDMIDWYADREEISLQVSGHTHGGQVRTAKGKPLVRPYLGKKYVQGLYRVNQSWVYTSRGIGTTGIPLRHNCVPEVTHLTLTCA